MNKQKRDFFKKRLLEEKANILKNMEILQNQALRSSQRDQAGDLSAYSIHMADMATDSNENEKAMSIHSKANKYYLKIEEALQRIEENTYGICISCHEPINDERLDAIPIATMCVACKEKEKNNI